jgi:hypothetical protein
METFLLFLFIFLALVISAPTVICWLCSRFTTRSVAKFCESFLDKLDETVHQPGNF